LVILSKEQIMLNKMKNQKGATLLETILAIAILGIIFAFLTKYVVDQTKELKLQGAAKQINSVLDNAKTLVKENFHNYYSQASQVVGGDPLIALNMDDIMNVYNSSDILSYKNNRAPLDSTYAAFVRIPYNLASDPQERSLQIILYAVNSSNNIKLLEAKKISRLIDGGEGGLLYLDNTPTSPCSGNECLAGVNWIINLGNLPGASVNNLTLAPAIAAVSDITETDAIGDYLDQEENTDNNKQNTMMTDLNIDDYSDSESNSAIFFNGLENPANNDKLIGVNLSYQQELGSPATEAPGFILSNNDDTAVNQPMLLSGGGLKTNLQVAEGDPCNVFSHARIIAADINNGELLSCKAVDAGNGSTVGSDPFLGNWRKIALGQSVYLFDKSIFLASGTSATTLPESYTQQELLDILGKQVTERAEFLIVNSIIRGNGRALLQVDMSNSPYIINDTSTNSNQSTQVVVPYLDAGNAAATNMTIEIKDKGAIDPVTSWTINVLGYIDTN